MVTCVIIVHEVLYCMTKELKLPTKSVSKQESKESAVI
jgi:hypothetical protein